MYSEQYTDYQQREMIRVYNAICDKLNSIECLRRNAYSAIETPGELTGVFTSSDLLNYLIDIENEFEVRYSYDSEALQYLADNCESLNDAIKLAMKDGYNAKDLDAVTLAVVWSRKVNMETFECFADKFDALLEEFQQAMRAETPEYDDELNED